MTSEDPSQGRTDTPLSQKDEEEKFLASIIARITTTWDKESVVVSGIDDCFCGKWRETFQQELTQRIERCGFEVRITPSKQADRTYVRITRKKP